MRGIENIIGLAPSELSYPELLEQCQAEYQRTTTFLGNFRPKKTRSSKAKSPSPPKAPSLSQSDLSALLAATGLSADELLVSIEKAKG